MGVSGSGKTHVGRLLADRLGVAFIDGDDYHSPASIAKMARGIPLDDEDRCEWLETLADFLADHRARDVAVVVGCSALKRRYRDTLRRGDPALAFLFLSGDRDQMRQRLGQREGHFFKGDAMLDSQFTALEPPGANEAVTLDIGQSPEALVEAFLQHCRSASGET
ncbi:gluconate kinase [Billgrantia endophytica]|uniref:Gluconokinase n=2 Tax=Billgrantia endophytica TaxID=2033802 RepID=A0A2N7U422_9GAMM|nr:gluconokinase [Halomonas endophytica]PMR75169.1 gluconate kinase [Halomonas endophytica]